MPCLRCGAESAQEGVCPSCASAETSRPTLFATSSDAPGAGGAFCSSCGVHNRGFWNHCAQCGAANPANDRRGLLPLLLAMLLTLLLTAALWGAVWTEPARLAPPQSLQLQPAEPQVAPSVVIQTSVVTPDNGIVRRTEVYGPDGSSAVVTTGASTQVIAVHNEPAVEGSPLPQADTSTTLVSEPQP